MLHAEEVPGTPAVAQASDEPEPWHQRSLEEELGMSDREMGTGREDDPL